MPQRIKHPVFARFYANLAAPALQKAGVAEHRRKLLSGLSGEVIEIGAGNGLNFPHYPPEVKRVVAVEPEPRLRALAGEQARGAPVPVTVQDARAEQLPYPDDTFDAAVVCLTLCSVADQHTAPGGVVRVPHGTRGARHAPSPHRPKAQVTPLRGPSSGTPRARTEHRGHRTGLSQHPLAELHRILRPGGQLRFFEHVQAGSPAMRRVQRVLDATVWPRLMGGCHTGRDTQAAIVAAGFTVTGVDRFPFPATRVPSPAATHILGTAERPHPGGPDDH
ncbi:class I SAM-dependent methyltransferase [Streptomyces sp. UG1]|uniref:class I SAM-dependent methyltransferase n=1 Tax=Streptomyces sp. UG1 TaxID=3417652 RepID=UPI003CEB3861